MRFKEDLASYCCLALLIVVLLFTLEASAGEIFETEQLSILVPEGWEVVEEQSQPPFEEVVFLFPGGRVPTMEENVEEFITNVNIIIEQLPQEVEMEEYKQFTIQQMDNMLDDFEILKEEEIELSGHPGLWIDYSGLFVQEGLEEELAWRQKFTIIDDMAYIITYTSRQDLFDNHLEQLTELAEGMTIK